ncbi:MliC family protein [Stutzerimonas kunmingensis]|uniref:MliC family protein n=1 Tax=Stutzerimonas kunmingensis TaxID=1211807 RepID=UPI0028ACDCE8|nr:MliC family protein [Stutzerimonas kunmingensis]
MNKGLSMLIAALLLGGCGHWQSGPDAPFVRWKCQSQQNIAWRYADDQHSAIDLKVGNDERIHSLRKEPATRGSFYSDGVLAFHDKGNEALVYRVADDKVLAHGCSASLISI